MSNLVNKYLTDQERAAETERLMQTVSALTVQLAVVTDLCAPMSKEIARLKAGEKKYREALVWLANELERSGFHADEAERLADFAHEILDTTHPPAQDGALSKERNN